MTVVAGCSDCGRDIHRGEKLQRLGDRVQVWKEADPEHVAIVKADPSKDGFWMWTEGGYVWADGVRCSDCIPEKVSGHDYFKRECSSCGAETILARRSFYGAVTRGFANYCSNTCRNLHYRDKYFGHTKAKNLTVDCEHCSEPFVQKRSDSRYCSSKCRVAAHRAKQRGEAVTTE